MNLRIHNSVLVMVIISLSTISGCAESKRNQFSKTPNGDLKMPIKCPDYILKNKSNNLNISVLLDLSDRIEKPKIRRKDSAYLSSLANTFVGHARTKKLVLLEDKMQLFFNPEPTSDKVNEIAEKLRIHFTKNTKKKDLDEFISIYSSYPQQLYVLAKNDADNNKDYSGSDIWRFFKDDVKDYCIDSCHRNILIILTDGYMYHEQTVMEDKKRTSYLTPQSLSKLDLNKGNWRAILENEDLGFIPATENLKDLEILVIGINSENKDIPYAYDIIEFYWSKWLTEMGVSKQNYKIKNAGIAANIDKVINDFIIKN